MRYNPFLEANQVISDGYIGRHSVISYIMNILNRNEKDSGVVISGLTRMGKTSLVKKCFEDAERSGSLKKNRIVTVSITISSLNNFSIFLKTMLKRINKKLTDNGWIDTGINQLFLEAKEAQKATEDRIFEQDETIRAVFEGLSRNRIKLVILLDEFDDAARVFTYENEATSANFQKFRDYASAAEYNITFILTCRTSISKIDQSLPSGSNLAGVFTERVLVGLTDEERDEFFNKIKDCGVDLNEQQRKDFLWYAGRSPFLFSKLAYGILSKDESIPVENISIQEVVFTYKKDIYKYFDQLIDFMRAEKLFSKIIQVFLGPVYDLTDADIEELLDYGYIYHDTNEISFTDLSHISDNGADDNGDVFTYQTLSQYFVEYMRIRVRQDNSIKLWSDLIDAEKELRSIVEKGLQDEFGSDVWKSNLKEAAISRSLGYLYDVNKADAFIRDTRNNFGTIVDDNPLTVISISSLGNIISAFWDTRYSKIFNPPYRELKELLNELQQLNRARNPLAHGTDHYLSIDDKDRITTYCKKITHLRRNGRHNGK